MKPSKLTKKLLYSTSLFLLLTGIAWLISHYFMLKEGEFGPEKHPLEIWSLRLHGLAGVFTLLCIGMLIEHHMLNFFKQKRRLWTGLNLTFLSLWLALSGYMLYYLSEDNWRTVFSLGHWVVGIVAALIFWMHLKFKKY